MIVTCHRCNSVVEAKFARLAAFRVSDNYFDGYWICNACLKEYEEWPPLWVWLLMLALFGAMVSMAYCGWPFAM